MFGFVELGYIYNLGLENVNVTCMNVTGGLAGVNSGVVLNCYVTGEVRGSESLNDYVYVGGLVGSNVGILEDSYSSAVVECGDDVGGLAGLNLGRIENCYAIGKVSGKELVGGLVGYNCGRVSTSYAIGPVVSDGDNAGGLIGFNSEEHGGVYSSYYDREKTGHEDSGKGEPRNTAEMKLRSTYEDWDFIEVWGIVDGEGYPMLRWQEGAPQSEFEVEASDSSIFVGKEVQLIIYNAKGEDGEYLDGTYKVTVYSDIYDSSILEDDLRIENGEAVVKVLLEVEGRHNLRIYVDEISYSNLVTIEVSESGFAGGFGTEEDPFRIEIAEQLNHVRHFPTAHFILVDDIDLGTALYSEGYGWEPIGNNSVPFKGSFDGNGKVIKNLKVNRLKEEYVGLFGYAENAVFRNIQIVNVEVSGNRVVGALVGCNRGGTIESCHVSGSVKGDMHVGGLVGINRVGEINYSSADVNVNSPWAYTSLFVGGLVGTNEKGSISNSHATGDVYGNLYIGGLVGQNTIDILSIDMIPGVINDSFASGNVSGKSGVGGLTGMNYWSDIENSHAKGQVEGEEEIGGLVGVISCGPVTNSYALGNVTGKISVGGLAGHCYNAPISDCYATGGVTGIDNVGGLVGIVQNGSTIKQCFAAGQVIGEHNVGGLVGYNKSSEIYNCYYDSQTTGRSKEDNEWGEPKTTVEMMQKQTFEGWVLKTHGPL